MTTHNWLYYEIASQSDTFTITKGIHCGQDIAARTDLAADANFESAWPAFAEKTNFVGRKGSSVALNNQCKVDIAKYYTVMGATVPYYVVPTTTMPELSQQATSTTPGWEDWDQDGNPGITGVMSGAISGKVYIAARVWTTFSGTVSTADTANTFKLSLDWDSESKMLAYDGSPLLDSQGVRAGDATLHFAQFARLTADQAIGDDATICESIRKLAPVLTPDAAGK